MTANFNRCYILNIGQQGDLDPIILDGRLLNPLQVTFFVDQSPSVGFASAEITIYGLSRETKRRLYLFGTEVVLSAGYLGPTYRDKTGRLIYDPKAANYGPIFKGGIMNIEHGREGADQYVRLYCRTALDPKDINMSWGPNTPQAEIIRDVAAGFGFPVEMHGDFSQLPPAVQGMSISKPCKMALDELANSWKFDWYLFRDQVLIVKEGAVIPGADIDLIAQTGMIGSPRITTRGVDVTLNLRHQIIPGMQFSIEAVTGSFGFNQVYYRDWPESVASGRFKVLSMKFNGNLYGGEWETVLEGLRL